MQPGYGGPPSDQNPGFGNPPSYPGAVPYGPSDPYSAPASGAPDPYGAPASGTPDPWGSPASAPPDPYGAPGGPPDVSAPPPGPQDPHGGYPAPANPYGPAGYPQAPGFQAPPANSGMAIGSLATGCVSLLLGVLSCCLVFAAVPAFLGGGTALVLGVVSMKQIDQSQGRTGGKGLAIGGMITGGVAVLVGLVWVGLGIAWWAGAFDNLN